MNRKTAIMALVIMTAFAPQARAQDDVRIYSIQYKPGQTSPLDERYEKCIDEEKCPMQLRLQLMDELYLKMGQTMQAISYGCEKADYNNCIISQKKNVLEWYRIHDRMASMMLAIEGRSPALLAHREDTSQEPERK